MHSSAVHIYDEILRFDLDDLSLRHEAWMERVLCTIGMSFGMRLIGCRLTRSRMSLISQGMRTVFSFLQKKSKTLSDVASTNYPVTLNFSCKQCTSLVCILRSTT